MLFNVVFVDRLTVYYQLIQPFTIRRTTIQSNMLWNVDHFISITAELTISDTMTMLIGDEASLYSFNQKTKQIPMFQWNIITLARRRYH